MPEGLTRPNLFGPLLAALMRPAPAVLHALRWALSRAAGPSGHVTPQVAAAGGGRKWRPRIALHIRTMSGHRARNLTQRERSRRLANGVMCLRRELSRVAAADASRAASVGAGMPGVGIAAPASASSVVRRQGQVGMPIGVLVSSSPEGRDAVQQRLQRGGDDSGGSEGGEGGQGGTAKAAALLVFDWRLFLAEAPEHTVLALQRSEDEAASFCSGINQTEAHRCRRAAHLRDWGPDPHWVALVELLLASSASEAVVGAGYPFFKARTTLA